MKSTSYKLSQGLLGQIAISNDDAIILTYEHYHHQSDLEQ